MEAMSAARPLFTRKRKSIRDLAMSHKCRSGHDVASFDYFVGQLLKRASEVIKSRLFVVKVSGTTMRPASGSLANRLGVIGARIGRAASRLMRPTITAWRRPPSLRGTRYA